MTQRETSMVVQWLGLQGSTQEAQYTDLRNSYAFFAVKEKKIIPEFIGNLKSQQTAKIFLKKRMNVQVSGRILWSQGRIENPKKGI